MPNTARDSAGKYTSAASISSAQDAAPRGPGAAIADAPTAARPGSGGMAPAASIAHEDNWAGAADQTSALLSHSGAGRGSGMNSTPPGPSSVRDYSAPYRSLGLGSNESAGETRVQAPGGRAGHGADVPPDGMPLSPAGAGADGAAEAGGIGELAGVAEAAAI
jgi:hypothetical protein